MSCFVSNKITDSKLLILSWEDPQTKISVLVIMSLNFFSSIISTKSVVCLLPYNHMTAAFNSSGILRWGVQWPSSKNQQGRQRKRTYSITRDRERKHQTEVEKIYSRGKKIRKMQRTFNMTKESSDRLLAFYVSDSIDALMERMLTKTNQRRNYIEINLTNNKSDDNNRTTILLVSIEVFSTATETSPDVVCCIWDMCVFFSSHFRV